MTKTLKHKNSNYKFYKVDIWGIIRSLKLIRRVYPRQRYNRFKVRRRSFSSINNLKKIFVFIVALTTCFSRISNLSLPYTKCFFLSYQGFSTLFVYKFFSSFRLFWGTLLDSSKFFTKIYNKYLSRRNLKFFVNCMRFLKSDVKGLFISESDGKIENKLDKKRLRKKRWNRKKLSFVSFRVDNISRFFYKKHLLRREHYRNRKKPFYFRLDTRNIKIRQRKMNKKFVSIRLTKLFFITLTHRQFRKLGLKSKKKDGFFEQII